MNPRLIKYTSWLMIALFVLSMGHFKTPSRAQESSSISRIAIRTVEGQAEFFDTETNESFVPFGVNYFWLIPIGNGMQDRFFGVDIFDEERVRADFEALFAAGYNTVRIFLDTCNAGPLCIGNPNGIGLNPAYLDNIVRTMELANETGLHLLLTSNDLPDAGGYWEISAQGESGFFAGYRNAHYLTSEGHEAAVHYWGDLMEGLAERNAPFEVVLGWSLLNEQWYFAFQPPLSLTSGTLTTADGKTYDLADPEQKKEMLASNIIRYMEVTRDKIHEFDPDGLVTMGFFVPDNPNPIRIDDFRYVETKPLLERAPLDFFDFHAYPVGDLSMEAHAQNFGMVGYAAKPIIMGEVGAFTEIYASLDSAILATQKWIAESCDYGFRGWLYWGMHPPQGAVGDETWAFSDDDFLLMHTLSPQQNPDPCHPALIQTGNLALEHPVTASRQLPEEPASNAVDGGPTGWSSGGDAPQWIEVDLENPSSVGEVRLNVQQYPNGRTHHLVYAVLSNGQWVLLGDLEGVTNDNAVLQVSLPGALNDVRRIRVETRTSVSWVAWREIEVIAASPDQRAACVIKPTGSVNLRSEPAVTAERVETLSSSTAILGMGQTTGEDGFVWWQVQGGWVRSDVVTISGACDDLPETE